jgi:hypothetical protein
MGICEDDKEIAMIILEDDDFDPPLIIEIKESMGVRTSTLSQKE